MMAFEHSYFIKSPAAFVKEYTSFDPAPLFRKTFTLPSNIQRAVLSVCGLGYGYWYLNGMSVSDDLFTAPISNYTKTLWYNTYDVTALLQPGENVAASILGNGFYNESLKTPWDLKDAAWRDQPKMIFELMIQTDKEILYIPSDESWKCSMEGPVIYHQLHNGEYYDARRFDPNWNQLHLDDTSWQSALKDTAPPSGVFRECRCEPIREDKIYPALSMRETPRKTWLFDIGQNISGYIRLCVKQKRGTEIRIRYAEQIHEDGTLEHNRMDEFYPDSAFETDLFLCSGEKDLWSPRFTYHGFRYIELEGLEGTPDLSTVSGVFVHQAVEEAAEFRCSDPFLNKLYQCGKMSTLSNLFYMPTDCPTREKLGWTNDAQASANQMLMNFHIEKLLDKWCIDILDSMKSDGALPGIVPTPGWGYDWCGPVADGILFELPLKIYLFTGETKTLERCYPSFQKYLDFLQSKADKTGLIGFGLADWAGPFEDLDKSPTPVTLIGTVLFIRFAQIAEKSAEVLQDKEGLKEFQKQRLHMEKLLQKNFMNPDGSCKIHEQTAISLLIHHRLYTELEPLKQQLLKTIEEHDMHHHCGMVGLRHLYYALNLCGCQDMALRIVTSKGYPSYHEWLEQDATTLWETWQPYNSKNHHMYSDVLYWMMTTLVGISPSEKEPGFKATIIAPHISPYLDWCEGSRQSAYGTIYCKWKKINAQSQAVLTLEIPENVTAEITLGNSHLEDGSTCRTVKGGKHRFVLFLTNT